MVVPSIWKPPQRPSTLPPRRTWAARSTSHPWARKNSRSAMVALVPGMITRSATGMGEPGGTIWTSTSGSSFSGSTSSKLAMRLSIGTATRRAPPEGPSPSSTASSAGSRTRSWHQVTTPIDGQPVRVCTSRMPLLNRSTLPRNLLMRKPWMSARSDSDSTTLVPTSEAMTPPRSISPARITGTPAASANPMLAMSPVRRLVSAGLPAPSTTTMSAMSWTMAKLSSTRSNSSSRRPPKWAACSVPSGRPCTTTWAPVSDSGLRSTGFW